MAVLLNIIQHSIITILVCAEPDIDSAIYKDAFGIINHNWYNNLSWRQNLSNGWKMNLGMSYSTNSDNITSADCRILPINLKYLITNHG